MKKKKHNGWKTAFIILLVLVVLFFVWAIFSDDEEDSSSSGSASPAELAASYDNETVEVLFDKDAVREKKVSLKGNGEDTVTVLVYMNGSNLETEDGEATNDLDEMVSAGSSDKVNVVVQTMNTKKWSAKYGISSNHTQIYTVDGNGLNLVKDNLPELNCADPKTLSDFIIWGVQNYPADRYILQFWNHGGGPVYGFGYDDKTESEDSLSIDEMQTAFKTAGVYFDFIGMDCCLMSTLETACAFYDYCDYMLLSEDFESGLGWSYKGWLKALYNNTSISTPELSKIIIDDMVNSNASDSEWGDDSIMALIDESMMKVLYQAWTDFAYANESALSGSNYSRKRSRPQNGRVHPSVDKLSRFGFFSGWLDDSEEEVYMSDYYVTDIMAVASTMDTAESKALASALSNSIVYVNSCGEDTALTGISVTLPYGDSNFYGDLQTVFTNCGFDSTYINWLGNFTSASGSGDFYDYDEWDDEWSGWDDYEDDYDWGGWFDDWDEYDDDSYWSDDEYWGWDDFEYENSWNNWYDEGDWGYEDDWYYEGDDWYYGDDYGYGDDWYYYDWY